MDAPICTAGVVGMLDADSERKNPIQRIQRRARARARSESDELQEYLMLKALNVDGLTYKLESCNGTIMGTVTVPTHWIDLIQNRDGVQLSFPGAVSKYAQHHADGTVVLRHAALYA